MGSRVIMAADECILKVATDTNWIGWWVGLQASLDALSNLYFSGKIMVLHHI